MTSVNYFCYLCGYDCVFNNSLDEHYKALNKAKTKKPEEAKEVVEEKTEQVVEEKTEQIVEVKEEKTEPKVTVEVVKEESPEVSTPEVSTHQPEVQPIVVVDTEKNKRKARIQPNKKPRQ